METPPPQQSAAERREERVSHILAQLLDGRAMREIAGNEGLSLRRVQQIVAEQISERGSNAADAYGMLQIARLERALDLLGRQIDEGRAAAVPAYVRVVEQLTKLARTPLHLSEGPFRASRDVATLEKRLARPRPREKSSPSAAPPFSTRKTKKSLRETPKSLKSHKTAKSGIFRA
jgi:hypothetical protein